MFSKHCLSISCKLFSIYFKGCEHPAFADLLLGIRVALRLNEQSKVDTLTQKLCMLELSQFNDLKQVAKLLSSAGKYKNASEVWGRMQREFTLGLEDCLQAIDAHQKAANTKLEADLWDRVFTINQFVVPIEGLWLAVRKNNYDANPQRGAELWNKLIDPSYILCKDRRSCKDIRKAAKLNNAAGNHQQAAKLWDSFFLNQAKHMPFYLWEDRTKDFEAAVQANIAIANYSRAAEFLEELRSDWKDKILYEKKISCDLIKKILDLTVGNKKIAVQFLFETGRLKKIREGIQQLVKNKEFRYAAMLYNIMLQIKDFKFFLADLESAAKAYSNTGNPKRAKELERIVNLATKTPPVPGSMRNERSDMFGTLQFSLAGTKLLTVKIVGRSMKAAG